MLGNFDLYRILLSVPAILVALTFHELSHGYVAYKLGDTTAKSQGRLSINPLKHLDPIGALFLLIVGFGWAKPVPVNPYAFKNKDKGMAIVAIAGPAANLIMALLGGICLLFVNNAYMSAALSGGSTTALYYLTYFFIYFIQINIVLMVFNLIPVPPLDGSRVLAAFLSPEMRYRYYQVEQFGMIIMLAMCLPIFGGSSIISLILSKPVTAISTWIYGLAGLV
ncbi:MAG: site-2 protease family protein [Bacillota bacterium]|nr:site-2 protease family protein [Bacillota bacterium]